MSQKVFSESVVKGLQRYEGCHVDLHDVDGTKRFYDWMNNIYDALNRTDVNKGLFPENSDFKVILYFCLA